LFRLAIAFGLIIAGVFFSQQAQSSGLPLNPSLIVSIWTTIVLLGWSAFQFGVFSDSWHDFTSPQKIVLKTEKTPFQIFMGSVNSCITSLIGGSILAIIALSVTGHGDVAVQIVQIFGQKLIRVIEALLS
jgi:hypothetical protein